MKFSYGNWLGMSMGIFLCLATQATAAGRPYAPSAKRAADEDYHDVARRELARTGIRFDMGRSAYDSRHKVSGTDWSLASEWSTLGALGQGFGYVRDLRWLATRDRPNFKRRSTWLYPDDGCYARADLMRMNLEDAKFPSPTKIFSFGNLNVQTSNHPNGSVSWWYHVAPLVRVGKEAYVLDPAIDPTRPLPVLTWLAKQNPSVDNIEIAICAGPAVTPSDDCMRPYAQTRSGVEAMQLDFLGWEWDRQQSLGRDPVKVLGDTPPWNP